MKDQFLDLSGSRPIPIPHDVDINDIPECSSSARFRRRQRRRDPLQPQKNLSPEFLSTISPARPVFLYRKRLEVMDVDKHQNRLLLTDTDRLREFLTEEEMEKSKIDLTAVDGQGKEYKLTLSKWGEKKKKKKRVVLALDSRGREYRMTLSESCAFVLTKDWIRIVRTNEVAAFDYVDLWGFRRGSTGEICIAVTFSRG